MKHLSIKKLFLFFLLFLAFSPKAFSAPEVENEPTKVDVGLYVTQIYDVSLRENKFSVDFYVWMRWKGDLKPIETFEVMNSSESDKKIIYEDNQKNSHYAVAQVRATINKRWDVKRFPLDDQILTINIEDTQNETRDLVFVPDTVNCSFDKKEVMVPGWKIGSIRAVVKDYTYETNYGDLTLPDKEAPYSRFTFEMDLNRPGMGYFWKLFMSMFITTFISFLAFFINPMDLDPRFGVGVGAFFAAVASQYVVASALPDTDVTTLVDLLSMWSIFFIFLTIAESTVSLFFAHNEKNKISLLIDRISFVLMPLVYLGGIYWMVK